MYSYPRAEGTPVWITFVGQNTGLISYSSCLSPSIRLEWLRGSRTTSPPHTHKHWTIWFVTYASRKMQKGQAHSVSQDILRDSISTNSNWFTDMKYHEFWKSKNWTQCRKVSKTWSRVGFSYLMHARQVEKIGYNFLVFHTFTDCGFYKETNLWL